MSEIIFCSVCGKEIHSDGIGTGYGVDTKGNKLCYECCGKQDEKELSELKVGKSKHLYLCGGYVSNWPGTLKIRISGQRTGAHNIAGKQTHVWFTFNGREYHGIQYGTNSQICHVSVLKPKVLKSA